MPHDRTLSLPLQGRTAITQIYIQVVTDSDSKDITAFQDRKEEEFNRRVNSSLKAIIEQKSQIDYEDVEDLMFLALHHYSKKNKALALKLLMSRINEQNLGNFSDQYIQMLSTLQQEADLKKAAGDLIAKIKSLQVQHNRNKQNIMKSSNVAQQTYMQPLKINPLIFQLKQSYNIERICSLLSNAIQQQADRQFIAKLENSVVLATNRFINNQYDQISLYGNDFLETVRKYWLKRGKKWQESTRSTLEQKVRQLNDNHRSSTIKSKLPVSRKLQNQQ